MDPTFMGQYGRAAQSDILRQAGYDREAWRAMEKPRFTRLVLALRGAAGALWPWVTRLGGTRPARGEAAAPPGSMAKLVEE